MPDPNSDPPMGPTIARNLYRLGYGEITIRATELARLTGQVAGKPLSRQRIAAIMNAVRVTEETVELLARAIGVEPAELLRTAAAEPAKGPRRGQDRPASRRRRTSP